MASEVGRFRHSIRTLSELQQLTLIPANINPVIERALAYAHAQIAPASIGVNRDLAPDLPQIPLDAKWLKDAIQNLTNNNSLS